jgi:hypothetical protein
MNAILGMALRLTTLCLANDPPRPESSWFALWFTNGRSAWLFGITYGPARHGLSFSLPKPRRSIGWLDGLFLFKIS